MTEPDNTSAPAKISLSVLPHSGKVDQLRREGRLGPQGKAIMSDNSIASTEPAGNTPSPEGSDAAVPSADSTELTGSTGSTSSPQASSPQASPPQTTSEPAQPSPTIRKKLLEAKVIQVLRKIYDPEIPLDIYELGLIYDIDIRDDNSVKVQMTLTAPACPVAGSLPGQVEQQIESIPEVKSAEVVLVWDPPWSRDRMSEAALLQLGML